MVWIHKDDAWKLQFPKKFHLITYTDTQPLGEDADNWIKLDKIPEGAKKAGAQE